VASDIKLAHSVFAMPFALLAAFMAAFAPAAGTSDATGQSLARFVAQLVLIVVAMILARTAAMLANRLLDRVLDARNPRTAGRALPSGLLSVRAALSVFLACAAGFLLACSAFGALFGNWLPLALAPLVLGWLCAYPLTKRFTAMCHLWLGMSLAMSPIAAAIAIEPASVSPSSGMFQPALWLLSAMVLCWVAGFDIIYALQDVEIDRAQRLHSMPANLGVANAMWVSRSLHAIAAACMVGAWSIDARFAVVFGVATCIVIALLMLEHLTVARWGTTRMALAFFTVNGIISCVAGLLGIVDVLA
jgi:4-hydroxybenzoate polyprenyltransferase